MNEVAAVIPNMWKDIAVQLHLPYAKIQYIEQSNQKDINYCYMQVFRVWENQGLESNWPYVWDSLLTILGLPAVNCIDLQQRLLQKLQPGLDLQHIPNSEFLDFQQIYPQGVVAHPHLWDLMNEIAAVIPHKWKDVAVQLLLPEEKISSIECSNNRNANHCYMDVFALWESRSSLPYTWETLMKILVLRAVDYPELKQRVIAKFPSCTVQHYPIGLSIIFRNGAKSIYYEQYFGVSECNAMPVKYGILNGSLITNLSK